MSDPAVAEPGPPTRDDLEPVRIAAAEAEITVSGLVLKRDVYYTLEPSKVDYDNLDGLRASIPRRSSTSCPTPNDSPGWYRASPATTRSHRTTT